MYETHQPAKVDLLEFPILVQSTIVRSITLVW